MDFIFDVKAIMVAAHRQAKGMSKHMPYKEAFSSALSSAWRIAKNYKKDAVEAAAKQQAITNHSQLTAVGQVVSYRGHNYKVIWSGQTKYGKRAKLSFLDGSQEFWADLREISAAKAEAPRTASTRCAECGGHATTTARDSSGIVGRVCSRCASKPSYQLSFA